MLYQTNMGTLLVAWLVVLSGVALCNGQASTFNVTFQMNGVTGFAIFSWAASNVNVVITLSQSLGTNPILVGIRPFWVDYDVDVKCSTEQLGAPIPGWSKSVNFVNNAATVVFEKVESLASIGGYSILLNGSSKQICASIESQQERYTAVAQFYNLVQGTVYFRKSAGNFTRIVTNLFYGGPPSNYPWYISKTAESCQSYSSDTELITYNPKNVNGNGCSNASQESCAVGGLSSKVGNVNIGRNKGNSKSGYTDKNIPSLMDLDGALLIAATTEFRACAMIKVYTPRKSIVEFSNDGVTGSITFTQASPFDYTKTEVNLNGLDSKAKGYHVHLWPVPTKTIAGQDQCGAVILAAHLNPFNKNVSSSSYPAPDTSTDDMYEVGDLSSKYGTLAGKSSINSTYLDYYLPMFGRNSIVGRSVVLHYNDTNATRWVCANNVPVSYPTIVAIAKFTYPVIGYIKFMQGINQSSETAVFAKLDYNDGRPGTKKHKWGINTDLALADMLSTNESARCNSTGSVFNPELMWQLINQSQYDEYCRVNSPLGCKTGDLSGKLGFVDIRNPANSDTATRQFFTDVNLPLSGLFSIIGRSVFIKNEAGTNILACATIEPVLDTNLVAKFSMSGITGTVSFNQKAGLGAMKTSVTNGLSGVENRYRLLINELPSSEANTCSDVGNVFDPFSLTKNPTTISTDDKYMVGNLLRYDIKSSWSSLNLPLFGLASIKQRSLLIVDPENQNKVIACATITTGGSSLVVEAVCNFVGLVNGNIRLFQTINQDGTMSDTSILVDLTNQSGNKTQNHNWHEHISPILGDASVTQNRCMSAQGHYDPFMTITNMANYATECKLGNPDRCETGDQSAKVGTYNIGSGRKLYTDVYLPLAGNFSGLGRSIVIHEEGQSLARLACADIIPVTSDPISIEIKQTGLNRWNMAMVYSKAIMANRQDIVVELISELNMNSKFKVHFLGFNRDANRKKFMDVVNSKDKSSLEPYVANIISASCYSVISTTLLLVVFIVQLLNNL